MKNRILAALSALVSIAVISTASWAGPSVPVHYQWDEVKFRAQVAANPVGVWDSLVTMRVGAAGASSVLDTTVAISTAGWVVPGNQALSDTSGVFCYLVVHDAPGSDDCESGADSLAVAMQGSADGQTWVTFLTFKTGTAASTITSRNNQTIVSGVFTDQISANGAALAAGQPVWVYKFKKRAASALDGVELGDPMCFPLIRFVLSFHDAKGYKVAAKIGHLSAVD